MKPFILLLFLVLASQLAACTAKVPIQTTRPQLEPSLWTEGAVVSSQTNQLYRYIYAPGPSKDAPNLLLLPGAIFDNRIWLYTVALSQYFNLYALDWPDDSSLYTGHMSDFTEITEDFISAINIDEFYLAGTSAAGYTVLEMLSVQPTRTYKITAAVLISSFAISPNNELKMRSLRRLKWAQRLDADRLGYMIENQVARAKYDSAPGSLQQGAIFYVRPHSYYKQLISAVNNQHDQFPDLSRIEVPVLTLHGTDDKVIPYKKARESFEPIDTAEWMEFEGLKHSMLFSHGPRIAYSMLEFFFRRNLLPTLVSR